MNIQVPEGSQQVWDPYSTMAEAEQYHNVSTVQQEWAMTTLEKCHFLVGANVLDVGCGTGIVTAKLASRMKEGSVKGLDVSEQMINVANQRFGSEKTNLSFQVGNAMALPVNNNSYEVVTAFNSLHWLSDPTKGLAEIHRVLKPEGKVVIVVPDICPNSHPTSKKVGQAVCSVFRNPKWQELFTSVNKGLRFTKKGLEESLMSIGFRNIDVQVIQVESVSDSREDLESWMYSSFTPVKRLTDENQRWELVRELSEQWLKIFKPSNDGSITLPGFKLEAFAQK